MQTSTATTPAEILYVAIEMSNTQWRLAFTVGDQIRQVTITAGACQAFAQHVRLAKAKLSLPTDAPVRSCYEAGRDGFWFHRYLTAQQVENQVVDAGSIEVARKGRVKKTDRLDARLLVQRLVRWWAGEHTVWSIVRVPSVAVEAERRRSRERERLKHEWTAHWSRLWSLLKLHGIGGCAKRAFLDHIAAALTWEGEPLPELVLAELRREHERVVQLDQQLAALAAEQAQVQAAPTTETARVATQLQRVKSIGPVAAWVLAHEVFGWRQFRNRREVGAFAGLTDTPWCSGDLERSQGISKTGNRRVRHLLIEVAWKWLRYQPDSVWSQWYQRRFAVGGRLRRIGIVALARKILIGLWRWITTGVVPAGVQVRPA